MASPLTFVTLVNDAAEYERSKESFARSHPEARAEWIAIDADRRGWNAGEGLNRGLEQAGSEWIVCAHQDVRFPVGWWTRVLEQVERWRSRTGREPGVVGLVGVNARGSFRGSVSDPHGFDRWGPLPAPVVSVDEHVVIVRRDAELSFDPRMPGFHCYGADLALEAQRRGVDVVVVDAPVVHLSGGSLDGGFECCAAWLLDKWGSRGHAVIPTCAAIIAERSLRRAPRRLLTYVNRRLSVWRARLGPTPRPALVVAGPDRHDRTRRAA